MPKDIVVARQASHLKRRCIVSKANLMTLDEFLLVIYEMGKGHEQLSVNAVALEHTVGFEFETLYKNADDEGYLQSRVGQIQLTKSGKGRVSLFQ